MFRLIPDYYFSSFSFLPWLTISTLIFFFFFDLQARVLFLRGYAKQTDLDGDTLLTPNFFSFSVCLSFCVIDDGIDHQKIELGFSTHASDGHSSS
jgi:hypothetical protein